jgi:hypothetical protein
VVVGPIHRLDCSTAVYPLRCLPRFDACVAPAVARIPDPRCPAPIEPAAAPAIDCPPAAEPTPAPRVSFAEALEQANLETRLNWSPDPRPVDPAPAAVASDSSAAQSTPARHATIAETLPVTTPPVRRVVETLYRHRVATMRSGGVLDVMG